MNDSTIRERWERLTKNQKLANLMVVVGSEAAALLLKGFTDKDVEEICREITKIPIVEKPMQKMVFEEFSEVIGESLGSSLGGYNFTEKALTLSKGEYRANTLLNRIAPISETLDILQEISDMDPQRIYSMIRGEQPQTIAFIIANLPPAKGASLLSMLPNTMQSKVIERIGAMDTATLEQVNLVVDSLKQKLTESKESPRIKAGGVDVAADLLKSMVDKESRTNILDKVEKNNPELGSNIRKRMFEFEDLLALSVTDLQLIVKDVDKDILLLAMKNISPELKESIFKSVSKRAAETLQEELEFLGAKRKIDVEKAQQEIIQQVKEMEEEGTIVIMEGDDVV